MIEFSASKIEEAFLLEKISKSGLIRAGKKIGNKQNDRLYDRPGQNRFFISFWKQII